MASLIVPETEGALRHPDSGVPAIMRALLRPGTYLGYAKEAVSMAIDAVTFPYGFTDAPARRRSRRANRETAPVLLVHGYGHNRSAWLYLTGALRAAGFNRIETMNYNPFLVDIPACGA